MRNLFVKVQCLGGKVEWLLQERSMALKAKHLDFPAGPDQPNLLDLSPLRALAQALSNFDQELHTWVGTAPHSSCFGGYRREQLTAGKGPG